MRVRKRNQGAVGWTRFDDRAKMLGGSAAISVFFWLVFSRKLAMMYP